MKQLRELCSRESNKWLLVIISAPLVYLMLSLIKQFDSPEQPLFTLGAIFSLSAAFLYSLKIIFSKQALKSVDLDITVLIFFISLFISLFLLPYISLESIRSVDSSFWWVFVISSSLYFTSKYFNLKAVSYGDISSVILLHSLFPIIVGFFGFLILGELPNIIGFVGVVVVVASIYILKLEKHQTSLWDPIRSLITEKGSLYMMFGLVCASITTNLDKVGSQLASVFEWVFLSNIFLMVATTPQVIKAIKQKKINAKLLRAIYVVSIFAVLQLVFQMLAVVNMVVVYVSALKATHILFTVLLGGLLFSEQDIKKKLLLGSFMIVGVLLISLFG